MKSKTLVVYEEKEVLVDAEDFPRLRLICWRVNKRGYAWTNQQKDGRQKSVMMHRMLMGVEVGDPREVDHINGNTLDNRKSNLRICTHRQNARNQRKQTKGRPCSSKYKGVSKKKDNGKFVAYIMLESKLLHLGQFDEEIEAARAYDAAAKKYFGEFARTNF